MKTMTLALTNELKEKMEDFQEINWSEVARQAFKQKIKDLEFLKRFKSESTLTEEDTFQIGKKIGQSLTKRLKKKKK